MGRSPGGHGGCTGSREESLEREFDAESDSVKKSRWSCKGENYTPKTPSCSEQGFPLTLSCTHPLSSFQNGFVIKFIGGQNPSVPLGSPALNKMTIFLQIRAFPLIGTLFLTPPPPGDCKHDLEWSKQVRGDICNKKLSSYSEYSLPPWLHDLTDPPQERPPNFQQSSTTFFSNRPKSTTWPNLTH